MKRVYGYVRVSSKGQVEGDGPDRQKLAIEYFCKTHGLAFAGHFVEEGVSGTTEAMDRPEFSKMMESLEAQTDVTGVVVERMDRLARDLMVSEVLLKNCRELGITVYCADQGNLTDMASEGSDPTRTLIRQIMGALAQWEKSNLVKKLKASRERMKAKSGRCEGKKPFGFYAGEKTILNAMAGMLDGPDPAPWRTVARMLNDAEMPNRTGTKWTRQSVKNIWLNHIKTRSK